MVWQPALAKDSQGQTRQLTGRYLKPNSAEVVTSVGECIPACVQLEFTGEGSLLFEQITTRLIQYPLGIFLDEELIGSPNVRSVISNGQTIITGLSLDEAKTLKVQLNTGALPVEMREIAKQEIDATLGENTLVRTVQAGLIGILAVMFFMVAYYRLPGVLASMALVTYVSTVMMVFKLFPGEPITITLPGIAGFVLSVGMAVDANVLVFERMKEELRSGRSLPSAIEHGFDRAWSSIRDSNSDTDHGFHPVVVWPRVQRGAGDSALPSRWLSVSSSACSRRLWLRGLCCGSWSVRRQRVTSGCSHQIWRSQRRRGRRRRRDSYWIS